MRSDVGLALAAFGASALAASTSFATPSARLVYVREVTASSCPDEASLRQAVKQRIGYDPFFPWARTTVVVEVAGASQAFAAHVWITDEQGFSRGARELRSESKGCAGLIDAAALAISIALDVSVPPPEPSPRGSPSEPTAPAPASAPAVAPVAAPGSPPDSAAAPELAGVTAPTPIRALIGTDALLAIAAAPSPTAGIDAWVAGRLGVGSLGFELRGDVPATAVGADGGHATVALFAATAAPCAHAGPLFACVLGSVGWLEASGADVRVRRSGSAFFPALGARIGLDVPLGSKVALRLRGDLLVNFLRTSVALDGVSVWTLQQVSALIGAGLAYRFP
jgi:hypothetical protein